MQRALLAAWIQELGDEARAERLFREVLDSAPRASEPRIVAERRLGLLPPGAPPAPSRADLARDLAIAVVPFAPVDPRVDFERVCLVLEAELWIPCGVLPEQQLPEGFALDAERNQLDAVSLLKLLHAGLPKLAPGFFAPERGLFVLGVVSHDLFAPDTSFVLSSSSDERRVAVMSTWRLLEDLPAYWEPAALAGRRVSIQALSAVGTALGFARPVSEHCPLAYPESVEAFVLKGGALCAGTIEARDALLARRGGERIHHDAQRALAVERARRAFLLDRHPVE